MDDPAAEQDHFRAKLEAIGFGFLIPVFFVSTGVALDVTSLFHTAQAMVAVPIFLVALLVGYLSVTRRDIQRPEQPEQAERTAIKGDVAGI